MSVFIAYQNSNINNATMAVAVSNTRDTFQPPMYGFRVDYEDLFAYEAAFAGLITQKKVAQAALDKAAIDAAESELNKREAELAALENAEVKDKSKIAKLQVEIAAIEDKLVKLRAPVTEIEAKLAALVKPDKVLPFVLIDRIVEHEGRAELVNGQVLFDDAIDNARAAEAVTAAKAERARAVAALVVEVDGMVFDGDEQAQERMARAVTLADSPDEQTEWVLHDNTVAIVTADQLRRACKLAGKAQTLLWTVPYTS